MFMMPVKITDIENVRVIHPLDDDPETKCGTEGLGQACRANFPAGAARLSDGDGTNADVPRCRYGRTANEQVAHQRRDRRTNTSRAGVF